MIASLLAWASSIEEDCPRFANEIQLTHFPIMFWQQKGGQLNLAKSNLQEMAPVCQAEIYEMYYTLKVKEWSGVSSFS